MSKENIYKNIQKFNDKHTDSSDTSSKTFREAYLYVSDEEAIDKAEFIESLISQGYMTNEYPVILDLTFGSGNLISHIVFDNDLEYSSITLNDLNIKKTNQILRSVIKNCTITQEDILDEDVFEDIDFDLVIVNPQIGGSYIDGNILNQKEDGEKIDDILYKLTLTLNKFYESGSTIVFYGKEKDFNSLFEEEKFYQYKSDTQNLFILKNDISETICFKRNEDEFLIVDCDQENEIEDEIESFDKIDLDNFEDLENKEVKEMEGKVVKKDKFSNEVKGDLGFQYKNILFKGVPGTGKSRAIDNIIEKELKIKDEKKNILRVNIHSASSNSDLMQGIGISSSDGVIKYSEKQGLILDIIKRATFNPKQPFVLILEEIQENSLNELIGDLIYLIEDDKRAKDIKADNQEYSYKDLVNKLIDEDENISYIEIPYLVEDSTDYKKMIMPNNLFIFCTSNYRDDKKVIEDNLLRRFEVIEIYPNNEVANEYSKEFFISLNNSILSVMDKNHETHPDRFIIGHSIWKDVKDEDTFYKAFSKLITEFKDIREIDFRIFKEILNSCKYPDDISIETKKSYFELIKDIQVKIKYDFID
ncbi:MAG: ATPase [Epsilonproteobacteria bacterium]|nr:MAG: ATPase [Campylobacterota bacterium]